MGQEEVGEHLLPAVRVNVGVQLYKRLSLVLRQPDGVDLLQLDKGQRQVGDTVASKIQHGQLCDVTQLLGNSGTKQVYNYLLD